MYPKLEGRFPQVGLRVGHLLVGCSGHPVAHSPSIRGSRCRGQVTIALFFHTPHLLHVCATLCADALDVGALEDGVRMYPQLEVGFPTGRAEACT
jgi:hypothetical protein